MHVFTTSELAAVLLQAAVTVGLATLFLFLHARHRKRHFLWWGITWSLYAFRLVAIILFLVTSTWAWLYWHQVITGWTALSLLWAALVFSHQVPWRPRYALGLLFPAGWAYVAIFQLDSFILAVAPIVVFLSATTLWTGVVFLRYRRRSGSSAALLLGAALLLWGIHHLDYPVLRARGAWNPWGYYLDTLFLLVLGAGVLLLVIEELRQGLGTLSALSGDLRRGDRTDPLGALLQRPLALRGVRGSALYRAGDEGAVLVRGAGACESWTVDLLPAGARGLVEAALCTGKPQLSTGRGMVASEPSFAAAIPLGTTGVAGGALLIVSDLAAPFTALDDGILMAVGAQIGAALENAELYDRLALRTADLERLSVRTIQQHEEHRQRLGRELHDETAQVFSALKLQLGSLREAAPADLEPRFDRMVELVDAGMDSIRSVTDALRPPVLDDLGLIPAVRALIEDFRAWSGIAAELAAPEPAPRLSAAAELALFRAVQEGLSNVARHAGASRVRVTLSRAGGRLRLELTDNGAGLPPGALSRLAGGPGRSGLFGMRERIAAQGGEVALRSQPGAGVTLEVALPCPEPA